MPVSDKEFRPKARRPRGFQDRRGGSLARERELVAKISKVYEDWGFEALETGAFEYADALGKFLPDQDRPNEGVFALEDDDDQWMALRYDLTAPLARFVAENYDGLPKPYRRWAAGPVWRNEKPGPGRFREFWQCDADTVGSASPAADAEMIAMACAAYEALGLKRGEYCINVSDRRLIDGLFEREGISSGASAHVRQTTMRAIDKFDRFGRDGVRALLGEGRRDESGDFTPGAKLAEATVDNILRFIGADDQQIQWGGAGGAPLTFVTDRNADTIENLKGIVGESELGARAIEALAEMCAVAGALGLGPHQWRINTAIVRGLEYYTGPVFEAQLVGADGAGFGSIGGGGRYDDLVARFTGQRIPATGFSIGVSRLAAALEAGEANAQSTDGPIVVLPFDKDSMSDCFGFAARLRAKGLKAEVYLGGAGPKAQLKYADRRNAPVAVILGGDERAQGQVTLKDLKLGAARAKNVADNREWREGGEAQITTPQADLEDAVARILKRQRDG